MEGDEERGEDFLFRTPPTHRASIEDLPTPDGMVRRRGGRRRRRRELFNHEPLSFPEIPESSPEIPESPSKPSPEKCVPSPRMHSPIHTPRQLSRVTPRLERGRGQSLGFVVRPDTPKGDRFTPLGPKKVAEPNWMNYSDGILSEGKKDYDNMAENFDNHMEEMVKKHMRESGKVIPTAKPTHLEISMAQQYVDVQKAVTKAVDTLYIVRRLLQGSYPPQYLEARVSIERKTPSESLSYKVRLNVKSEYRVPGEEYPSGLLHTRLSEIVTKLHSFILRAQNVLSKDYSLVLGRYTMKNAFFRILTNLNELEDDPFPDLDDAFKTPEYFGERLVILSKEMKAIEKDSTLSISLVNERKMWMEAIGTYQSLQRTIKRMEKQLIQMQKYFYLGRYPDCGREKHDVNAITCSVFPSKPMEFRKKIFRFQIALVKYRSVAQNLSRFKRIANKVC
ncbi:MAG: hypothetical protein ACTSUE_17330 [Promethearchaeota archaeon]